MNIMNIEFGHHRSLTDMVDYITNVDVHTNRFTSNPIPYVTGFGINPEIGAQDMLAMQQFHNKNLLRQYWQIELSLEHVHYTTSLADVFYNIGKELYQWSGAQLIMAIHTNTHWKNNCIHCHYVLNSIRIDGTILTFNKYSSKAQLEGLINKVLAEYKFAPVNIPHNKQSLAS